MTTFSDPDSATVAGPKPPPHVLRGPAHADNFRIKVGRYKDRWYRDPLPADDTWDGTPDHESYPSVSIIKGASGKDWTFVALKRVAHADDLADIASKGYFERYERLKVINQLDLSAAMRRGTNVHTWAECIAYGIPQYLNPNGEGGNYFPIVDKLFAELNPTLIAAEFVCIHRTLNGVGYGGTSDGIFEIDGRRYMVDWKSRGEDSDHDAYPEEAGQIGAYCAAQYVIAESESSPHGAIRMAMPKLDGGLIVSIKPDSYEVYPIDLPRAADHFAAMHEWWNARRIESQTVGPKWPPRRAVQPIDSTPTVNPPADPGTLEEQLEASIEHVRYEKLRARHDKLTKPQRDEFKERCNDIDTTDLDQVEHLLDVIENPPTILQSAQARMENDARREADRRLSGEGGPADPDDVKLFELRWDLNLTAAAKRWVAGIVDEAIIANNSFQLSLMNSQRRADLYCALTEWAEHFDGKQDREFRAALDLVAADSESVWTNPIGVVIGQLWTHEAAALRHLVTEIVEGRMALVIELDGAPRWEQLTTSES